MVNQGTDKQVYPLQNFGWGDLETATANLGSDSMQCDNIFGVYPFFIAKGNCVLRDLDFPKKIVLFKIVFGSEYYSLPSEFLSDVLDIQSYTCPFAFLCIGSENCDAEGFEILAPTTRRNALRVLRAMQLPKPGNLLLCVPLLSVPFLLS